MEQRKHLHVHYAERGSDVYDIDKTSIMFMGQESSGKIFDYLELVN